MKNVNFQKDNESVEEWIHQTLKKIHGEMVEPFT